MINRVLIRIKVVQMLYSYFLTQSEFAIIESPSGDSRDRRYAHQLYLDTLMLILRLSGCDIVGSSRRLPAGVALPSRDTKMARALMANPAIVKASRDESLRLADFDDTTDSLLRQITDTEAYRSFVRRKNRDIPEEVELWIEIVKNVFEKSSEFEAAARRNPDFTLSGLHTGLEMVVTTLGSYGDSRRMFREARASLKQSLDKAYQLYNALLLLCVDITALRDRQIDDARHKYLPTDEDLNPPTRFIDNKFVAAVADSEQLADYLKENPFSWENDPVLIKKLLDDILASKPYAEYMTADGEPTFADDAELWRKLYRRVILPGDELALTLENKSVYWNDDIDIMGDFVTKTIHNSATTGKLRLLPKYKDDEDAGFGPDLFVKAVEHRDEARELINQFLDKDSWDSDRIAFMDAVIITCAVTEMLCYPQIPLAVTINEYVEMAKAYSTPGSGAFVNGILYNIAAHLRESGRLMKK